MKRKKSDAGPNGVEKPNGGAAIVLVRHRSNLARLLRGKELGV